MLRSATVVTLLMVAGCASHVPQHQTYPAFKFVPLESELELLPPRSATECANEEDSSNRSSTPNSIGPGFLFEQTKQKIIATDDGVIVTSATTSYINNQVCISMTGRPYRIARVKPVHGAAVSGSAPNKSGLLPLPDLGGE